MGAYSKIEWTDHTFNAWIGCTKVAPGCTNCYAESFAKRTGGAKWGPQGTRVKTSESYWRQPLKWNREAEATGVRRRVFCASLADVFEEWAGYVSDHAGLSLWRCARCGVTKDGAQPINQRIGPSCCGQPANPLTLTDLRGDLFELVDQTPWLDWLLLTKRPENIIRMWPSWGTGKEPGAADYLRRDNVWLGTSVSDQETADTMVPRILACRRLCSVLFLSAEPLLGPVDLFNERRNYLGDIGRPGGPVIDFGIDWVIVGGESGPHARHIRSDWPRSLRDQCQAAGVPFFFKQWGEWLPFDQCAAAGVKLDVDDALNHASSGAPVRVGKTAAGRLLDGREWNEFPDTRQEVMARSGREDPAA